MNNSNIATVTKSLLGRQQLIWHFTDEDGNLGDTIYASTRTKKEMKKLEKYGFEELSFKM